MSLFCLKKAFKITTLIMNVKNQSLLCKQNVFKPDSMKFREKTPKRWGKRCRKEIGNFVIWKHVTTGWWQQAATLVVIMICKCHKETWPISNWLLFKIIPVRILSVLYLTRSVQQNEWPNKVRTPFCIWYIWYQCNVTWASLHTLLMLEAWNVSSLIQVHPSGPHGWICDS